MNDAMQKHIMDVFVKRPVVAIVLSIIICLAGIFAATKLAILQFPEIENSSLTISTTYIGASAKTVKGFVTEPIEKVASSIPGVDYVDSTSIAGSSTVTVWLKLNQDSNRALAELSAKLSQIDSELPDAIDAPIVTITRTDRAFASFGLDVKSEHQTIAELTDFLTRQVSPKFSAISGVQSVEIFGKRKLAMRVWLNMDRLNAYGLSSSDVYLALANNNSIATLGYTEGDSQRIDLVANTQLETVAEFEQMIVKQFTNGPVYLKDIAEVELGAEEPTDTARLDRRETVFIMVKTLPGSNEIAIGNRLYSVIDDVNLTLPHGIKISVSYDATQYMRHSLKEIFTTLIETIVLVGLVVVLLMGSLRTAIVPLITIPISILGAIFAMSLAGFSLNLLTVLAIVLCVGLVVDDAIVVVENVARLMREGQSRMEAALNSRRQLFVPIVSMTLTLAAVYTPIGFLSGLTGALFKEFAFTLAIAVLMSGVVAITLSPIMSSYVSPKGGNEGWLTRKVNGVFTRIQTAYAKLLYGVFGWKYQIILAALIVSLFNIPFYFMSKKELAPVEDQSGIQFILQSPPDASLAYNTDNIKPFIEGLLEVEEGELIWQVVQQSGGFAGLELVNSDKRDMSTQEMLPIMYGKTGSIAGLDILPILPAALPTAGQFDIEVIVKSSEDYGAMAKYAYDLIGAAYQSGIFLYADTDLKLDYPRAELVMNRERLADFGLTVSDVNQQLAVMTSSGYVNRFESRGKAYKVIPTADEEAREHPEQLLSLSVTAPDGETIPLTAFAYIDYKVGPRKLTSFGQQSAFRIYGGIVPGKTKEQALQALESAAEEILPKSYSIDYAGESRQLRSEGNTLVGVMGMSLIIVYLLLSVQFNSFRDPLVVLLGSVPLALSGALMLAYLELTSINIYSQIGLITLTGLIAKNGILIVEFAKHMQEQGKDKLTAVIQAATTRLRPVLMTTFATVLGHFPLVLVTGAGAEARNSIGIILVAGMLIGTVFTLLILPIFYVWLAEDRSVASSALDDGVELKNEQPELWFKAS